MPTVGNNLQPSFRRSPNTQQHKREGRIFTNNQKQLKTQNATIISKPEHVTKTEINPKQLIKDTTVAATTAEVKPENVKDRPQSQGSKEKSHKQLEHSYSNAEENNGANEDYRAYENSNVNDFYEKIASKKRQTIGDICLVNDHFIFVKMSDQNTTDDGIKLNESVTGLSKLKGLKSRVKDQKKSEKLCCYLRSKRNRVTKIAPILEEPEDLNSDEGDANSNSSCLKLTSCWQANEQEVEVYHTKTKVYKNPPSTIKSHQTFLKQSSSDQTSAENSQCLEFKQTSDIPTITGSLFKSSLQYKVALHHYGSLLESQNNIDNKLHHLEMANKARQRKCPRFGCLYWLLRPFRRKIRKTEPKIQAVVYKTYFVKWTKPPDTLKHGYAVKTFQSSPMGTSVLRRCRSAQF